MAKKPVKEGVKAKAKRTVKSAAAPSLLSRRLDDGEFTATCELVNNAPAGVCVPGFLGDIVKQESVARGFSDVEQALGALSN